MQLFPRMVVFRLGGGLTIAEIKQMVLKTRDKFIEMARQLFARKGVENTTMNDIASASSKGRRTIYTYFKSKSEIFNAVISSETERALSRLRLILSQDIPPDQKIVEYIDCRFETMKEVVSRNGTLRGGFFRDFRKVDRARKIMERKEIALLREILEEGNESGHFKIEDTRKTAVLITQVLSGLDIPYNRNNLNEEGIDHESLKKLLSQMLLNGITG